MNDLGIGVVGLGRLGYVHAVNAAKSKRGRLAAVCDQQEDLASDTARELGCSFYTDLDRMLENKEIDAVCVVTPTALHVDPVQAVAEAGKALFCEKPLASTLDDTLMLAQLIKQSGILCQIGFHRRFDPSVANAQAMISDGAIGKPVFFNAFMRDPFPPPPWACDPSQGGGLYIDFLLHDFDEARFLMQDEVVSLYADETNLVVDPQGIKDFADNAVVSLRFAGGALGSLHASMHASYGYDVRAEVFGSEGNLIIGGLNRTDVTLCSRAKGITKPETFLPERGGKIPHFMVRYREAFEREMESFIESVLTGTRPAVTEDDAVKAFKIALAAGQSAGTHQPAAVD